MIKVLFVCHGNICRSAAGLYIMKKLAKEAGMEGELLLDSAATSTEELGNPVYPPMRRVLESHGVPCAGHSAKQMKKADYDRFDYLIASDDENLWYMNRICGGDPAGKFHLLLEFAGQPGQEIADPWYTGDFERAYRDTLLGCKGLLRTLLKS